MQQLVEENPQCPNIDGAVVLLLKDHLRCHVFVSPTESFPFHLYVVCRPPQVTSFHVEGIVQKDVFGLNNPNNTLMSLCIMS